VGEGIEAAPWWGEGGLLLGEERVEKGIIKFYAEVDKVQTTADSGIRVVLGLGEDGLAVMQFLARCKQQGIVLDIVATAREE